MNSLMLLVAKILGVKSEGADSDVFALMEGAMNVMGIHNLLPQSARRVDIAEVATELLSGDQILIRTAGSKQRFHHGIFVGPISGVQGGKNLVVDCWGSQDAGKQEAKIRLRTLGEFMAVPGWPELADPSSNEESNASEEPMTTTVEDYDALLRELENCRIKNQTLIKHNDELKLISETTMHENILLKSQLVPELSPYHFGHDLLTSLNLPFCNTKCCIVMLDSSGARQCKNNRQATGLLCTTHASSPKHVAEKVNKAYATRCFERQAKVISASQTQSDCRQQRALLVSPSYATPGLDIRTRYVMEKTGVLPSDLGKYSTEGFARDAAVLRRQLGPGFSFETLEGEVLSSAVLDHLKWLLSHDTEVAVLLFCGHGMWQGSPQHGSLVCSFKQLVTAEAIECVAEKFQGTFVSSIIDARGGIAVSGFLSNAALTLTDSGGGLALLSAPLHSTQDVHLQKELKVHGNATFDTHVSVNGTLYAKNLHPSFNTFQASNILISQGGIIQFGEGVSSTISFSNAPDTGLFNPVARTLGVVAGGTEMVRVSDTTVSLLGDLVVSSNIVPMTNATQYIGTSTMHFKEAWIDELHISSNTLYIGDTPVLCADNDAVSIRADPGQGITITTTGDGETSLVSAKGVNVVSEGGVTMRVSGPLGRVNIQSSGAGGTVNLGAENEIVMTAPLTTISSNMIVKGDLIVEGTQLTVNTQTVKIEDNIIVLNSEHVMEHWESWDFRPDKDKSKSLDTIQRYFAAADGDSVHVEYAKNKHGRGRLFAKRGLSMQCVMREVRNAVAHPFYVDLDFVNCHPTLFSQRCRKRGVACPLLDQYCGNRTEVLGDIDADAALGKTAVLSVMNGSKTAVYKHQDSVWLRDFQNEMNQARDEIMAPGGADEFYIDIARKDRNTYASAVNLMLCDLENECLMAMLEYLDKKSFKVGVLEMLDEASDYVWDRTGYRLQIKIKDMTIDMLDVPASAYMGAPVHAPRYAGGDDVAAKILLKDLGGKLVKSKGVVFGKHGDVWTNDKDVVESFMFTACQRANIKFVDESGISRKYSCLYTKAINIVKTAKHYIPVDDNFVKKIWESNLGVLCFRNGVFRFRDKSFAPFSERPEVMPVIVIDRDFPSERPTDELLEHVKEKVLVSTLGEEGRVNTYLQMIARSMAAKHQDKQWGMLIGERNSGKGLLQALNERAWGQYVNTIDSSVLMLNNFTNDVKSQGWMIECEFTRQTYTNEIKVDPGNKHIKLDGGLIKKFQSGGDVLKARQLYENERALKSASRLFMNLNDLPEISAVDALDTVVVIEFPHKFVNPKDVDEAKWLKFFRPADPSLKDGFCAREDVRDAFIWLVIDAFDQEQPLKISDVVRRDTEKLRMDEGDELSLINAHFKITTDLADVVTVADVNEFAKDKKMKTRGLRGRL
eukprot:gene13591-biopygen22709